MTWFLYRRSLSAPLVEPGKRSLIRQARSSHAFLPLTSRSSALECFSARGVSLPRFWVVLWIEQRDCVFAAQAAQDDLEAHPTPDPAERRGSSSC